MKFDLSNPSSINWSDLISAVKSLHQNPIHPGDPLPTLPDGRIPYFAYGSNLDRQRMSERCPGAECLGPAQCPNATIQFRKYATLVPHITHGVPGLVYALTPDDLSALDRCERYPDLYLRYRVVLSNDLTVFTYIMREGARPLQPPPLWYFDLIANAVLELPEADSHLTALYKAQEAATNGCALPAFRIDGKHLIFANSAEELWEAVFDHRGPFLSHLDPESYLQRICSMLGISPEEARSMSFEEVSSTLADAGILVPIPGPGRVFPSI
jgi:gamma-glutamylcyclotransferase (GGCT)/AIG2-like uncharacterized protein YtfP